MKLWGKGGLNRGSLAKKTRAPYLWELGLGGHCKDAHVAHYPDGHVRHAAVVHGHMAHYRVTDPRSVHLHNVFNLWYIERSLIRIKMG